MQLKSNMYMVVNAQCPICRCNLQTHRSADIHLQVDYVVGGERQGTWWSAGGLTERIW